MGMSESGYRTDGYKLISQLVSREVRMGILARMKVDLSRQGISMAQLERDGPLLRTKAVELYGHHYPMFTSFLWGMTPAIEAQVGEPLLPTYCYFRIYRKGDICRIHGDRLSCEHSVSLTLAYSDELAWPLEVGRRPIDSPYVRADERF